MANPLDDDDSKSKGTVTETAEKAAARQSATDEEALTSPRPSRRAMLRRGRAAEAQGSRARTSPRSPERRRAKDKPVKKAKARRRSSPRG